MDSLTIVIPCKNERMTIVRTLTAIANEPSLRGVAVIVADSSDDVMTRFILDRLYFSEIKLQVVNGGFPARARNIGAQLVTTPYVLFLDADMIITKPITLDDKYDLVTCVTRTYDGYAWAYRVFEILQRILAKITPFALGGYMLFKTEVFRDLGGFVDSDKVAEDFHLSMKISPEKFHISDQVCYTTARRLHKKGLWYMIKLMIRSWINRNNSTFFTTDHGYWT